jgi:transmembrane sensor
MKQYWKDLYQLLNRYLSGKASAAEKIWMDTWYDSIANKPETYNERDIETEMWKHIESNMDSISENHVFQNRKPTFWRNTPLLRAAACVVLLSGFAFYTYFNSSFFGNYNPIENIPQEYVSFKNVTQQPHQLQLPDSSQILLNPGASIAYPLTFSDTTRKVFLTGDAFFDIISNPSKPFIVQTAALATRVLGTSFTITEDLKSHQVEVSVATGIVEVIPNEAKSKHHKLLLTANKKATYLIQDDVLIPSIVREPKIIQGHSKHVNELKSFHYQETALNKILNDLSKSYGVKIELEEKIMESFLINADLSEENNLFSQLDILCAALDLSYEIKQDRIYLNRNPNKNSFK